MKFLICLMVSLFALACGSEATAPEGCNQGYEKVDGVCQKKTEPECWGDGDCPAMNKCIENICIEKPECAENEDCGSDTQVCDFGTCREYQDMDQCLGQECTAECTECGPYSTCVHGTCVNGCTTFYDIKFEIWDAYCTNFVNTHGEDACMACTCWLDDHRGVVGLNERCTDDPTDYSCSARATQSYKSKLAEKGIAETEEMFESGIRGSCPE
jgi:hypothetical protein